MQYTTLASRAGSWPGSELGDDDHPDIRGSGEPVPHDSEPSPKCPHTGHVGRDHITGQRGCLGMLCPPDQDRRHRLASHAAAATSSSSNRLTAQTKIRASAPIRRPVESFRMYRSGRRRPNTVRRTNRDRSRALGRLQSYRWRSDASSRRSHSVSSRLTSMFSHRRIDRAVGVPPV